MTTKLAIPTISTALLRDRAVTDDIVVQLYEEIDAAGKGNITVDELQAYAKNLAAQTTASKSAELFSKSAGADGKLTSKEIRQYFALNSKDIIAFIESGDGNDPLSKGEDNLLTEQEFVKAFTQFVHGMVDVEVAQIKLQDRDGNGIIIFREFEHFLKGL